MFFHDLTSLGHGRLRWQSDGVDDDSIGTSFYFVDFLGLPVDRHVFMNDTQSPFLGQSNRHRTFRDRQVTTGRGETYGPFSLDDATTIYRFDTHFTAKRLRFELLETTGGNTGALEIEVYGDPVP